MSETSKTDLLKNNQNDTKNDGPKSNKKTNADKKQPSKFIKNVKSLNVIFMIFENFFYFQVLFFKGW